jgi:putative copper resistance protein D
MLALAWLTSGAPALYGRYLFSVHVAQLVVCSTLVPLLVVAAAPGRLASLVTEPRGDGSRGPREWLDVVGRSRCARVGAHPVVAGLLVVAALVAALYTDVLSWSLESYAGRAITTLVAVGVGCLLARGLVGFRPPRAGRAVRGLVLGGVTVCLAALGLALATSDVLLAPDWYGLLGRTWGPSAIADQHRGGVAVWCVGALWLLAVGGAPALTRLVRPRSRRR